MVSWESFKIKIREWNHDSQGQRFGQFLANEFGINDKALRRERTYNKAFDIFLNKYLNQRS